MYSRFDYTNILLMNIHQNPHGAWPGQTTRRPPAFPPPSPRTQPQAALGSEHFLVSLFSLECKVVLSFYFQFFCTNRRISQENVLLSEHCEITHTLCVHIIFAFVCLTQTFFLLFDHLGSNSYSPQLCVWLNHLFLNGLHGVLSCVQWWTRPGQFFFSTIFNQMIVKIYVITITTVIHFC